MWTRTSKVAATDRELDLREELVLQSGVAIERLLAWLVSQIADRATWSEVPWWVKRAPQELDGATLQVLKHKPPLDTLMATESIVVQVVARARKLDQSLDLTRLEVAMRCYVDFRRSERGNLEKEAGRTQGGAR